jgi:ABC-type Fe3+ transport system permease subunit
MENINWKLVYKIVSYLMIAVAYFILLKTFDNYKEATAIIVSEAIMTLSYIAMYHAENNDNNNLKI